MKKLEDYLYYEEKDPDLKIYCGDCLEIMPLLPPVDLLLADPPYGMNYKCDMTSMAKRGAKYGGKKWDVAFDDSKPFDPEPFLKYPNVILWGYNHFAQRLPKGTVLVWIKVFDEGYGAFFSDAELAWMNRGEGVYCKRNTEMKGITKYRVHPTQKPVGIMKWCIQQSKYWDIALTVLDPFLGSGTTLVACKELNRSGIGIEISEKYCAIAKKRLKATCKPLFTDVSGAKGNSSAKDSQSVMGFDAA